MTTHAHRAGEFGSDRRVLRKNPAYQASRAQHWAKIAKAADVGHASSTTRADTAKHLLAAAHAERKASGHARAAQRLDPDSIHAARAKSAHDATIAANEAIADRAAKAPGISTTKWQEHYANKIVETGPVIKVVGDAASKKRAEEASMTAHAFENIPRDAAGHKRAIALHTAASEAHKAAGNETQAEHHREFAAHAAADYEDAKTTERAEKKPKSAYRPKY